MLEGILALLLGQFAGSTIVPIVTKLGLQYASPLLFVFFRFFFASLIFFFFYHTTKKKKLSKRSYGKLMVLAGFLFTNVTLFSIGIQYTTVLVSQILYTATPVVVGVLAYFFLGEHMTKEKILGLLISLSGVLFLLYQSATKEAHLTFGSPVGNGIILFAMLGYSAWIVYSRKLSKSSLFSSSQLSFFTFVFISLYVFLLLPFEQFLVPSLHHGITSMGVIDAAIVAAGSVILYFFIQYGITKTSAFTASLFQYIGPFFSGIVSIPLLHEQFSPLLLIGSILIISGVFYATTYTVLKKHLIR